MSRESASAKETSLSLKNSHRFSLAVELEGRILTGRVKPGEHLREAVLAKELDVSQASIREALQDLEGRGLVVKIPNRGTFVIEIDPTHLFQIYQVRRELEPLACSLLAGHLSGAVLETLNRHLEGMREASGRKDYPAYLDADLRFHRALWAAQPNRLLEKNLCITCLPLFAYDLIRHYDTRTRDFSRSIRQHGLILNAVQTGDPALATRVARRMIDRWYRENLSDFSRYAADPKARASDKCDSLEDAGG